MHVTECPAADQPSTMMSQEEALRLLANTRRTLLKLVKNIDEAISTVDSSQERKEERAAAAR